MSTIASSELAPRIPSALYADLFYSNPGAGEYRADYLGAWLQIQAATIGRAKIADLTIAFSTQHPGCLLDEQAVRSVCESLAKAGSITLAGDEIDLTRAGAAQVDSAKQRYATSRGAFLANVRAYVTETEGVPLTEPEAQALDACLEQLIVRCLLDEKETLLRLYKDPTDFSSLPTSAGNRAQELSGCFATSLPGMLRTRQIEIRRSAIRALSQRYDEGKTYLHSLQRAVVGSFFLVQDPHHTGNLRDAIRERTYFIDSNVYLAWLYASQSSHGVVKPLLETLRSHGVRLAIMAETVQEILSLEKDAHSACVRAQSDSGIATYCLRNRKAISSDYLSAQAKDANLSLPYWERIFVGAERILPTLGVEIVTEAIPDSYLADSDTFRNAIKGCKEDAQRIIREDAIDHDVAVLLRVAKRQLTGERDQWGSRTRFLTLDRTLNDALMELRNALRRRYELADHPLALAGLVVPTSAGELSREEYEEFVVSSVQQYLGVTTEMGGYGAFYLIEKLGKAGVPVQTLLEAPAALVEPALADLQSRKGLSRRLEQAIATPSTEATQQIGREIADAVALSNDLLVDSESRLAAAQESNAELTGELGDLKETIGSLSEQLAEQRSRADALERSRLEDQAQAAKEAENRRKESVRARTRIALAILALLVVAIAVAMSRYGPPLD